MIVSLSWMDVVALSRNGELDGFVPLRASVADVVLRGVGRNALSNGVLAMEGRYLARCNSNGRILLPRLLAWKDTANVLAT